jgi:aldehyde dehydrogenase family 7 protein A1
MESINFAKYPFLAELGLEETNLGCYTNGEWKGGDEEVTSHNPHDNSVSAKVKLATLDHYEECIKSMEDEKERWFSTPAPARGEIVRQIGDKLREKKDALGSLISLEMGKIKAEGDGEVQEVIDICDLACGLSRSLEGKVLPSERPGHMMLECWNPLGIVGVITAFNFPCAVFGWNACIGMVCGDLMLWKGAPSTPLVSIATTKIFADVLKENGFNSIVSLCQGDGVAIGEKISNDPRIPLVSFTGSTKVGRIVSETVSKRFGKCILELGGNNAVIVMDDANTDMALKACAFSAVGTCGQRCTSLRRIYLHDTVYDDFVAKLVKSYSTVKVGSQLDSDTLMGPLHSKMGVDLYTSAIEKIKAQGGEILTGGKVIEAEGNYVEPTVVAIDKDAEIVKTETFAPIVYVFKIKDLDEAIKYNNSVPQGLSSSLFTNDIGNYFKWIGPNGSDCGLVNCNIGSSGAEIGGAFGGEKETGGGRESGSDAWKQYMRRSTCTINFSKDLPLAQGIKFDV